LHVAGGIYESDTEIIRIGRDTSTVRYHSIYANASATPATSKIQFKIHDGVTTTSQATVLTLTGAGNVGIGTTNPTALLDLTVGQAKTSTSGANFITLGKTNEASNYAALMCEVQGGASQADRRWIFQTVEQGVANAGSIIFQKDGGNVGIGTDNPVLPLVLQSSGSATQMGISNTGSGEAGLYFDASNGDFSGSDYAWIAQSNTLNLMISTGLLSDGDIIFSANDSEKMRIASATSNVEVKNGNLVIGTAGKGIDFSAQTAGSPGVSGAVGDEILDHYEEGTFTPTMSSGSVGTVNHARYVRIGSLVHITLSLNNFSGGTSTGTVGIYGLPFSNNAYDGVGTIMYKYVNLNAGSTDLVAYIYASNTLFRLYDQGDNSTWNGVQYSQLGSSSQLIISATYEIA
jgi:hypothetical protein